MFAPPDERRLTATTLVMSPHPKPSPSRKLPVQDRVLPDPSAAAFLYPAGEAQEGAEPQGYHNLGPVLRDLAEIFRDPGDNGVSDWSTSDWLSTKVLGPYVAWHPRRRAAARSLMGWAAQRRGMASVWMRRAGMVSFVNLVQGGVGGAVGASGAGLGRGQG